MEKQSDITLQNATSASQVTSEAGFQASDPPSLSPENRKTGIENAEPLTIRNQLKQTSR